MSSDSDELKRVLSIQASLSETQYRLRARLSGPHIWSPFTSVKLILMVSRVCPVTLPVQGNFTRKPLVLLGTSPFSRMLVVGCLMMVSLLDLKLREYRTDPVALNLNLRSLMYGSIGGIILDKIGVFNMGATFPFWTRKRFVFKS